MQVDGVSKNRIIDTPKMWEQINEMSNLQNKLKEIEIPFAVFRGFVSLLQDGDITVSELMVEFYSEKIEDYLWYVLSRTSANNFSAIEVKVLERQMKICEKNNESVLSIFDNKMVQKLLENVD